jgi:hypothetical protein
MTLPSGVGETGGQAERTGGRDGWADYRPSIFAMM